MPPPHTSTQSHGTTWLDVPFSEKDEAKRLGARWDPDVRRWHAPLDRLHALAKWVATKPDLDPVFPGEDRTFGDGLFIDLIPATSWFVNVRSCVTETDWDRIRRCVAKRTDDHCELCGDGPDHSRKLYMEAHERWSYDTATKVQRLERLICVCSACHRATHFGMTESQGRGEEAIAQLMRVNGWTREQVFYQNEVALELANFRSMVRWSLDLSLLTNAGIHVDFDLPGRHLPFLQPSHLRQRYYEPRPTRRRRR